MDTPVTPRVVACIDHSHLAPAVAATALAIARLIGSEVDAVHVGAPDATVAPNDSVAGIAIRTVIGTPETVLVDELRFDGVEFAVIGSRNLLAADQLLGHVSEALVTTADIPIAIVPPNGRALPDGRLRVLLPLDGDPATSHAVVAPIVSTLASVGDVVPLHVFGGSSAPMFITSDEDRSVLAEEFAARHAPGVHAPVELRIGHAADEILDAAAAQDVDAIVVGWHRHIEPDRARVVRRLLEDGRFPLILHPVRSGNDTDES
ncbi:MAG: universal stress protein [Actinomycetota bacterium]